MPRRGLPEEVSIELGLDDADHSDALRARVAAQLGVAADDLPELHVRKRSLDARRGRVRFHVTVALGGDAAPAALGEPQPREVAGGEPRVAIVGGGPAGLFCAYQLARAGIGCTVLDRGKPVQARRHDLAALQRAGRVDPDSNYCFGEGGAGTYSDGKLYTRSHKRGDVRDVIEVLALHGAPERILTDARPHIGSNRLPKVVTAVRERLEAAGVRFPFEARVTALVTRPAGAGRAVAGVRLADGAELGADAVVLAAGHSARDVHALLADAGVTLEAKPFAVGVRIEHPQPLIDRIQYGACAGHPRLPAAAYRLAGTIEGRGVFSFCMCPGGWVVPASTEPGEVVVNGMSLSRRDSPYASAGLVVALELADLAAAGLDGPLGGVELQRRIERAAFAAGGSDGVVAPATRATDFARRRASSTAPATSYLPGLRAADVGEVLDAAGPRLADRLRAAMAKFDRQMRGFITEEAVLIGVESRTSSPVRVPRDPETLESREVAGLYPCGEGAGFAGGIVSAAIDGIRVARAITAGAK
jgi:uncharacterized FAD-dependent dehydrogenase